MSGELQLNLLGKLQIQQNGQSVPGLESVKGQALLVYLAMTRREHTRSTLADLLWSDMPEETARTNLRVALSKLRKAVGAHLTITRQTVAFNCQSPHRLDVAEFEAAATHNNWRTAADLYGGDFLGDFYVPGAPVFEDWVLVERERLRQITLEALNCLVDDALQHGQWADGIRDARRLLVLEPWRESTHRHLMELLARNGQRSAALTQYETCRRILAEELGVEPAAATVALVEKIKSGGLEKPPVPEISAVTPVTPAHNLPAATTSFVGRQAEQTQIAELLADAGCRLLTLVGPGGIGKTRLAQAAAAAQLETTAQFTDGIFYVPLAALEVGNHETTLNPLALTIGETIGLSFSGSTAPETQLLLALQDKKILLLLDNFEHLTHQADLLVKMLERAPGLKIMVTSRESLNLYEEWILELQGLAYPDDETVAGEDFDSVDLFVQRARRVHLGFSLAPEQDYVARICRLLEGMPLGIELAVAWVRTLSCREIAEEIERNLDFLAATARNTPTRQQSLRAVFEHSWQLLSEAEQDVLPRLTVFRGGFTGEAAATVAGAPLRVLSSLVEKSLVQRTAAGRYEVHELICQYGAEKLLDEIPLRAGHAQFYAHLQARHQDGIIRGQPQAIDEINQDIENVRAAWEWNVEQRDEDTISLMLAGLSSYYGLHGWFQDGVELLRRAADAVEQTSLLAGRLWQQQAHFYDHLGHYEQAVDHAQKSVTLAKQFGTSEHQAAALGVWGFALAGLGDNVQAKTVVEESLHLFKISNNLPGQAIAHYYLVFIATGLGDRNRGLACAEESLRLYKQLDHRRGMAECLYTLGNFHIGFGNYHQAKAYYGQSETLHQTIGNRVGVAQCSMNRGLAALREGALDEAEQSCRASLELFIKFGKQHGIGNNLNNLGQVAAQRGNTDLAIEYFERSLAIRKTMGEQLPIALTLAYLGDVTTVQKERSIAPTYYRQALEIARNTQAQAVLLDILAGIGPFLAQQGHPTLAVETLVCVIHHPTTEHYARSRAEQDLQQLATTINSNDIAEAKTRGKTKDLAVLTQELLTLLQESE